MNAIVDCRYCRHFEVAPGQEKLEASSGYCPILGSHLGEAAIACGICGDYEEIEEQQEAAQ